MTENRLPRFGDTSQVPLRKKLILTFLLVIAIAWRAPTALHAADAPFNNVANWGGTGLMEIPNARVLEDGHFRVGLSQAHPYRWYAVGMGIFPGLEASGRVTELRGVPGVYFSNQKSRSIDLKYQIFPESKRFPALAVGLQDRIGDAQLYPAEYIVMSRQFYPLDISLGIGHNRLAGDLTLPGTDKFGLFGGIELAVTDRIQVMAEYNPIQYEEDRSLAGNAVPDGADWPVNFGLRMKPWPGVSVGLSYQRGDTLGFMVHLDAELGKPVLPHRPDPPALTPVNRKPFRDRDMGQMAEDISRAVRKAGFHNIFVHTDEREEITAEFGNASYISDEKAVGRVLRILLYYSPEDCRRITAVVRRIGMPILRVSVDPEKLEMYLDGNLSSNTFAKLVDVRMAAASAEGGSKKYGRPRERNRHSYNYGIKPEIETFLLDRTNYVQARLAIKPWFVANLWDSAYLYARYDIPLYAEATASADIPDDAVRSDVNEYLGDNPTFESLLIDQSFRIADRTFGRVSAGYLEKMYAGVGGEVLSFLGDGRWAFGAEADWALKREPGTHFGLQDYDVYNLFGTVYCAIPELDLVLDAKIGRFLYGDYGARFQISRKYDTGGMVGAWYSVTDSGKFTGENEGYNDAGVFLSVPIQMFLTRPSAIRYSYAMKPWTRDVGASIVHWNSLYWTTESLSPNTFMNNLEKMKN